MGALSGMLGTSGGAGGTGFAGPGQAALQQVVQPGQVDAANAGVNQSLGSSQALLAALAGQNGVKNQEQQYGQGNALAQQLGGLGGTNAMSNAMGGQGALAGQLGGANGVGTQQAAISGLQGLAGQQQGVANQYQNIANGTGPNPAQAMLNQSTGANVANQAALMAGQRGAGSNVGLMAREAGQQGAATQQQAAGQAATMQAQQQIAGLAGLQGAQAAMGNTQQAIGGMGSNLTAQQQAALAQQYGQGAGTVGQQQAQMGQNAGIAQNQIGNYAGAMGQNIQGNIGNAGQVMGAQGQYNATQAGQQENINSANAGMASTQMGNQKGLVGGVLSGAASALGLAEGGDVDDATASDVPMSAPTEAAPAVPPVNGPVSSFGKFMKGFNSGMGTDKGEDPLQAGVSKLIAGAGKAVRNYANSPDQSAEPTDTVDMPDSDGSGALVAALGGKVQHDYRGGGKVTAKNSSEKAVAKGDNYANDKVKAMLSEGEVVLPRSVMNSKDPTRAAAEFVANVLAKRGKK